MKSKRLTRRLIIGVSIGSAAAILAGLIVWLPGCGDAEAKQNGGGDDVPAPGSVFIPSVETAPVEGEDFTEYIELPGVSVVGMESTPLFAKVGGFVKEIRRVGRAKVMIDGRPAQLQITDTMDRQTYKVRDVELRIVGSPPKPTGRTRRDVVRAADPDELKSKWPKLYDAYQQTEMMELDIGSNVEAGTLLSVLDIPEMADELRKQQAAIERAKQTVLQKDAAVRSATAHVGQAKADYEKAKAARAKLVAVLQRDRQELVRIERLGNNVDRAKLEAVQFNVEASKAALASADEEIKSAAETVKVAKAAVEKATADKNVAVAQVKEADAELARLKTLENYASIRAPFTGTIVRRFVDHGAFVQPAQGNSGAKPLFAITQTDKVRVVIPVPGRKSYKIRPGQEAVFHTIGGLPGVTVEGTITRSADTLDETSRMLRVEMYLKNPVTNSRMIRDGRGWKPRADNESGKTANEKVAVRPGMFGVVTVRNEWKQLRMIPATALGGEGDEQYVLEFDAGKSELIKRHVTVVFNDAQTVGISAGIPVGAQIVAAGVSQFKDGQKVTRKE